MLLEYVVSNFKSIGKETVFSMLATPDDSMKETLFQAGRNTFGNKAIIYGANGSGKTSLLESLAFLKSLISTSFKLEPGSGIHVPVHKLFAEEPTCFSVQFTKDGIRYAYSCTLQNFQIQKEWLYYFPKGRQAKIFERDQGQVEFGTRFKTRLRAAADGIKPNKLLLSMAANLTSVPETDAVYSFFTEDLVLYRTDSQEQNENWFNYSLYQMYQNPELKYKVIQFLRQLDIPVEDLEITIEKDHLKLEDLPPFLNDELKARLVSEETDRIEAKVKYSGFSLDLFTEESAGVRKLLEFLCPFLDILEKGKVLFCDEIESCLHESIVYRLIEVFNSHSNDSQAQMICTTHDTNLLDLNLFRRDQIWFAELEPEKRSTDLYSLTEIKDVRKGTNIARNYREGKYGAVPKLRDIHISDSFRGSRSDSERYSKYS